MTPAEREALLRAVHEPVFRVRACEPPHMGVMVGREFVELPVAHVLYGRIDLVCVTDQGKIHVLFGTPSCVPVVAALPLGCVPFATVHVHAATLIIRDADIEEWHP